MDIGKKVHDRTSHRFRRGVPRRLAASTALALLACTPTAPEAPDFLKTTTPIGTWSGGTIRLVEQAGTPGVDWTDPQGDIIAFSPLFGCDGGALRDARVVSAGPDALTVRSGRRRLTYTLAPPGIAKPSDGC